MEKKNDRLAVCALIRENLAQKKRERREIEEWTLSRPMKHYGGQ